MGVVDGYIEDWGDSFDLGKITTTSAFSDIGHFVDFVLPDIKRINVFASESLFEQVFLSSRVHLDSFGYNMVDAFGQTSECYHYKSDTGEVNIKYRKNLLSDSLRIRVLIKDEDWIKLELTRRKGFQLPFRVSDGFFLPYNPISYTPYKLEFSETERKPIYF